MASDLEPYPAAGELRKFLQKTLLKPSLIHQQFVAIKTEQSDFQRDSPQYSMSIGSSRENLMRNRYKDILPYDATRVPLDPERETDFYIPTEDEQGNYINASFIKGATGEVQYIAAQAPIPHTLGDFWRMVVQYDINQILMLCNMREDGRPKCEKYWPSDKDIPFPLGRYEVALLSEEHLHMEYTVRKFMLKWTDDSGQRKERPVLQYHYTAWPDHGVPETVYPLLEMMEKMHLDGETEFNDDIMNTDTKQQVKLVHCSAGCGRTGTIIALDIVRQYLILRQLPSDFDVYHFVLDLRKQRASMVQSNDQYQFLHTALVQLLTKFVDTSSPLNNNEDDEEEEDVSDVPQYDYVPLAVATDEPSFSSEESGDFSDVIPVNGSNIKPSPNDLIRFSPTSGGDDTTGDSARSLDANDPSKPAEKPQFACQKPKELAVAKPKPSTQNSVTFAEPLHNGNNNLLLNIAGVPVPDWPDAPALEPRGPEAMPWPDAITH